MGLKEKYILDHQDKQKHWERMMWSVHVSQDLI
jgi:hypothetical protein